MADNDKRPVVIGAELELAIARGLAVPLPGASDGPKPGVLDEKAKIVVVEGNTKTEWEFTRLAAPVVVSPLTDPHDRKLVEELREVFARDEARRRGETD